MKITQDKFNQRTVNLSIQLTDAEIIILDKIDKANDYKNRDKVTAKLAGLTEDEIVQLQKIGGIMPRLVNIKYPEKYLQFTQLGMIVRGELLFIDTFQVKAYEERTISGNGGETYSEEIIVNHFLSKNQAKLCVDEYHGWIDTCNTRISEISKFGTFVEDIDDFCDENPELDHIIFTVQTWDDTTYKYKESKYQPIRSIRDHKLENILK